MDREILDEQINSLTIVFKINDPRDTVIFFQLQIINRIFILRMKKKKKNGQNKENKQEVEKEDQK